MFQSGFFLHSTGIYSGDATFRDYSSSLQSLNIERLPFSPLRGLTVVKRNDVLNGFSGALA